ncbi:MAG: Gfo/Idh/MocA family protein [Roseiflexaceae bacterium]
MKLAAYEVSDQIALPPKHDYGIGIVGCGGIVNYAHLPAYRANGLNVVACYDVDRAAAERTAREHSISTVAGSLAELLADQRVQIVDIAVPPWHQLAGVEQAAAAGKHMLCQKPLADDYRDALRIVQLARSAGVKLAVNQQMRWDAGIRVARQLIDAGALGRTTDARIQVSVQTPWDMWPWLAAAPRLEIMFHSIHYLDSLRYLFGDPARVSSFHTRYPGQKSIGETKTLTVLEYGDGLQVLVDVNHSNWSEDSFAIFRFLGTDGVIKGTIGLLYDYPKGRVDTLEFQARGEQPGAWHSAQLSSLWIPDAFIGPMASLMEAIQTGGEPLTSGADNLKTLQIANAAYRSAAERRAVELAEIAASG